MRRASLLAALVLSAACAEVSPDRPVPAERAMQAVSPPAAAPDTLPRPAPPSAGAAGDTAGGVTVTHAIHPSLPPHRFTLLRGEEEGVDGEWAVRAIRVRAEGAAEGHELPVSEPVVGDGLPPRGRLLVEDLDLDGYADLGFVVVKGATGNAWADYWRFDPSTRRFVAVGTHPVFSVDSAGRQMRAHQKGGHAGLLFAAETYRWIDGRPVLVRAEEQDTDGTGEGYVRTVRELREGRMTEVARRVLTREEAIAEAEGS